MLPVNALLPMKRYNIYFGVCSFKVWNFELIDHLQCSTYKTSSESKLRSLDFCLDKKAVNFYFDGHIDKKIQVKNNAIAKNITSTRSISRYSNDLSLY